ARPLVGWGLDAVGSECRLACCKAHACRGRKNQRLSAAEGGALCGFTHEIPLSLSLALHNGQVKLSHCWIQSQTPTLGNRENVFPPVTINSSFEICQRARKS